MKQHTNMYKDFISGAVAGVVSRTMVAPIELYRVQRQNSFIPNSTLNQVFRKEGVRYLWKGNGTNCLRVVPQLAINWSVYQKLKPGGYFLIATDCHYRPERKRNGEFLLGDEIAATAKECGFTLTSEFNSDSIDISYRHAGQESDLTVATFMLKK